MTVSPPLERELDLRKIVVTVNGTEIQNRAGREQGGVTTMVPEPGYGDPRIRDVAGTFVGWLRDPDPEDTGVSGVISVQLGSESAVFLANLADSRGTANVVFQGNESGLGFETITATEVKFSTSPVTIDVVGVTMFSFTGWGYEMVPIAEGSL